MPVQTNFGARTVLLIAALALFTALPAAPALAQAQAHEIYPAPEQAAADLAAGLKAARAQHKNLILDFGGNWCPDCRVLDIYFHDSINKPLLENNYVLVDINIGRQDRNLEIAQKYGVDVTHGVPALVVLDQHGKLVYSQRNLEFRSMRRMGTSSVTSFLLQWKPTHAGM